MMRSPNCKTLITSVISIVLLICSTMAFAFEVPPLSARVNDHAHMFSVNTVINLELNLANFEAKTTSQISIVTIESLQGANLEDAAVKTANAWALGRKNKDNGLLIFIAKQDHAIRIEVGAGLESIITDVRAGRIIDGIIIPNFKAQQFDQGINDAVNALMQDIDATFVPEVVNTTNMQDAEPDLLSIIFARLAIYCVIISPLLVYSYFLNRQTKELLAQQQAKDVSFLAKQYVKRRVLILPFLNALLFPLLFVDMWIVLNAALTIYLILALFGYLLGKILFSKSKTILYFFTDSNSFGSGSGFFGGGGGRFTGGGGGFRGGGSSGRW